MKSDGYAKKPPFSSISWSRERRRVCISGSLKLRCLVKCREGMDHQRNAVMQSEAVSANIKIKTAKEKLVLGF